MSKLEKQRDLAIQEIEARALALKDASEHLQAIFPLQTIQSMAERWGVARQTVNNWMLRHPDFPKPAVGFLVATARTPLVFANVDMLRYERNRGLLKGVIE